MYEFSVLAMLLAGLQQVLGATAAATTLSQRDTDAPAPAQPKLISTWDIQSSAKTGQDVAALSIACVDVSSWYHIDASRCTLMGCLIDAGIYNDSNLFFSDNLVNFDRSQFSVPWVYRYEFSSSPSDGQHYFLENNGITSKADIYLNGQQIANSTSQVGAYAGHTYDITSYLSQDNALAIQVYPTDYNYDFALGFVDWNPYPPDNGTGVWRDVFIKQTGPVALSPLRVTTDFQLPAGDNPATVTLLSTVQNYEDCEVTFQAESIVFGNGTDQILQTQSFAYTVGPLASLDINLTHVVEEPAIWWPKVWGEQPLYSAKLSLWVDNATSDAVEKTFGIRKVTSGLNQFNDTSFSINGNAFQVLGGGYSSDMFLRWDSAKFTTQVEYMLDLGLNTVRLEGKNEHPELYDIADRMGLMVLAGWECCDKWEAWSYNEDLAVKDEWSVADYSTANASMRHEISMLQNHPSILGYLIGSDYWPDDRATAIYLQAFKELNWQNPIIASASLRGYPGELGPSGMKMAGPYDWVPPNYWYDVSDTEDHLGAAFGFGSELGAGVGTPELGSLEKFLTQEDLNDLWKQPDKGLYHMSTNVSSFYNRKIYSDALWARLGEPTCLDDYLIKTQIMDYEATRAQFEGYSSYRDAERPATGMIYWMVNNAWPSLHWNLFDYYLRPAGSYFGAKMGSRVEHVAYDYVQSSVYLINHSLDRRGSRSVAVDAIDLNGNSIYSTSLTMATQPYTSKSVLVVPEISSNTTVMFLRLVLTNEENAAVSRNVYWLTSTVDTLDWENSDWYYTPVTNYTDFTALDALQPASLTVSTTECDNGYGAIVVLENLSDVPAFFVNLNLVDAAGKDILPVTWTDNYVTLWPREKLEVQVNSPSASAKSIVVKGKNVEQLQISVL
ncbi:Exo-beta-D-glucosaminidase [Pestalotiopsis fici W106-1]|uniref:Exo-beta-D-glucosaminidase n=1 Tax=Pestalotiopsis fici (strain W106-1 / CGMCC3.15140) TaxID=1229662 RepID=W3XN95_PESFW|nr:Exo-beta-D-glucosaminidase [Pestalotiopsis fici W106-1]ETS87415.1 Exo-beta-D-glucosaminidase [Pestalotiopsis fici W106-1]